VLIITEFYAPISASAQEGGVTMLRVDRTKKVSKIKNLKGAKALVILPKKKKKASAKGLSAAAITKVKALFYVTSTGVMKEITYTDAKGKSVTLQVEPLAVYDINSTYFMVLYGTDRSSPDDGYLIRKTDGKMFSLAKAGLPTILYYNFKNEDIVRTDQYGNIFYPVMRCKPQCWKQLTRLDVSNPAKLKASVITPLDEDLDSWAVDSNGNVMYQSLSYGTGQRYLRIRKVQGGLESAALNPFNNYWLGLDNAFYVIADGTQEDNYNSLYNRLVVDQAGAINRSRYASVPNSERPANSNRGFIFRFADRIVIASTDQQMYQHIEAQNPAATPRVIADLGLSKVGDADQTEEFYFLAGLDGNGNGGLVRVSPYTDQVTPLVPYGSYTFYDIALRPDNSVMYSALRMSDGRKVLGLISPEGVDRILSASGDEVVDLEPIN